MIYEQLEAIALPFMEAYKEDLVKIDRQAIEQRPGIPFLHFTRRWGTSIEFFPAPDSELYPPPGVRVPYLFGTADREHILRESVKLSHLCNDKHDPPYLVAVHFDGKSLRRITFEQAACIADQYERSTRAAWARANGRAA